jgi:hypothetical protein
MLSGRVLRRREGAVLKRVPEFCRASLQSLLGTVPDTHRVKLHKVSQQTAGELVAELFLEFTGTERFLISHRGSHEACSHLGIWQSL